jgi:hypothetical protein
VELLFEIKMEVKQMKKILDPLGIPPDAIHFLAGNEITFDLESAMNEAEVKDKKDFVTKQGRDSARIERN